MKCGITMWKILPYCPHKKSYIQCMVCNRGPICIHGNIQEMCRTCVCRQFCDHKIRRYKCDICKPK